MNVFLRLSLALVTLLAALPLPAQQSRSASALPSITYKMTWPEGRPWVEYTITVAENGATHFSGTGNSAEDGNNDAFQQDFRMSEANRQKIFELAKAANYFEGQFDAKQKNIAKTGVKTLEYHSPTVNNSTTYNYSPNANIQQLTKFFQGLATTVDYGRKLAFQYRFDKLGMDKRLQELVDLQASGMVDELQAIEPILRKIADDPNLMNIARTEAKQLLKSAGAPAVSPSGQQASRP